MNTENETDKAPLPPEQPAAERVTTDANGPAPAGAPRTGGGTIRTLFRLFVLLAVIGGLALAGWFGWQWLVAEKASYDAAAAEQAERIAQLESRLARLEETRVAQDEFEELRGRIEDTQATLRDRMEVIASDMDALREAARGGRRDLVRAEIEYLLRVAADALYLTQDVDTAIYALQAADDRLRQLAEPRLMPVRRVIADHLQVLGTISVPDINGMALKLGSLMRQVSALPLRQQQHARKVDDMTAAPAEASWWQRFRRGVARLFDKLVVVQRAEPPPPLLKPEEHFFLYRNVELQLAAARAALLTGDLAAYRQSLEMAREWLNRYFDGSDPAVANAVADISGLLDVSLQPSLPDITEALERFRTLNGKTLRPSPQTGARTE